MQTVHLLRFTLDTVRLTAVETFQDEAVVPVVGQLGFAQMHIAVDPRQGMDLQLLAEAVSAFFHLLDYLLTLPLEPVRDMVELGLALKCLQIAIFLPQPALATGGAEKLSALGIHGELLAAVGALVQHLMQTLGPVRLLDENTVVLLVLVFIVPQLFAEHRIDFAGGHGGELLRGEDQLHFQHHGNLAGPAEVPEGGMQVVAMMDGSHDGDLIHFHQLAQRGRQESQRAAGGVAGLGVHGQHIAAL